MSESRGKRRNIYFTICCDRKKIFRFMTKTVEIFVYNILLCLDHKKSSIRENIQHCKIPQTQLTCATYPLLVCKYAISRKFGNYTLSNKNLTSFTTIHNNAHCPQHHFLLFSFFLKKNNTQKDTKDFTAIQGASSS